MRIINSNSELYEIKSPGKVTVEVHIKASNTYYECITFTFVSYRIVQMYTTIIRNICECVCFYTYAAFDSDNLNSEELSCIREVYMGSTKTISTKSRLL